MNLYHALTTVLEISPLFSQHQLIGLTWFLFIVAGMYLLREDEPIVTGQVIDEAGPVVQASVRWQGERTHVLTDLQGRFTLPLAPNNKKITASKTGYLIASAIPSNPFVTLTLVRWPKHDPSDAEWISPHPDPAHVKNCANCHGEIYREWSVSAHAQAAHNPKFLQLLAGSVQAQRPEVAGVCASCHVPTLRAPAFDFNVQATEGIAKSGIHCDYCHKVVDAPTDKIGTRFGRDALELLRPSQGKLLTFGPLEDAVRSGESFGALPLYRDSRFCAACHEGTVFGVHTYGTYSEWLASPARRQGKQCQDCHMAPNGRLTNLAPGKGGIERDPATLASHRMQGGEKLLRQALQVKVRISPPKQVEVELKVEGAGHRVPTGFPDRQLLMVVTARDQQGQKDEAVKGSRLPPSAGRWAGMAGSLYAKQLFDEKGHSPISFWEPVEKVVDSRLFPDMPNRQRFLFADSARKVKVQVWYRRFWDDAAQAHGWLDNDVLLYESSHEWEAD